MTTETSETSERERSLPDPLEAVLRGDEPIHVKGWMLGGYLRDRGGWDHDPQPRAGRAWCYLQSYESVNLHGITDRLDPEYPYPPRVTLLGPGDGTSDTDRLVFETIAQDGTMHSCPAHTRRSRELVLSELSIDELDAALTEIEIELAPDEAIGAVRCRLFGPCGPSPTKDRAWSDADNEALRHALSAYLRQCGWDFYHDIWGFNRAYAHVLLDAALTAVEVELEPEDVVRFVRCGLNGTCQAEAER